MLHNLFLFALHGLSQSHDLSHKSCGLVWLTKGFFVLFLIEFFFYNFIFQHWID